MLWDVNKYHKFLNKIKVRKNYENNNSASS